MNAALQKNVPFESPVPMKLPPLHRLFGTLLLGLAVVSPLEAAAMKIGVLLKGQSAFWSAAEQGCVETGKKLGVDVVVKMPVSESDIAVQIQLLDGLVAQGIQALVIAPCSTTALSGPVTAAAAKGIKIVVIDTAIDGEMPVFIATNHTDAGAAAGRLLASVVSGTDEVSFLKHSKTSGATTLREVSAFGELRLAQPSLVINRDIFTGTEAGHEIEKAHQLLTQHPATKAILASGTPGSMAMLKALEESKRAGTIKFVGFGFNLNPTVAAALDSGAMLGWIAQLPTEIGSRGLTAAVALLNGQAVQEVTFCDFLVITKANLHEPRVQALLPK